MMRSLRARLMVGTGLTAALLVGAASVTLYFLVRSTLYAEFDQLLAARARVLAGLVEQDKDQFEIEFAERPLYESAQTDRPEYFQVWLDDDHVLARSRHLQQHNLDRISGEAGDPQFRFVRLPDKRPGRLASVCYYLDAARTGEKAPRRRVTVVVARETDAIDTTLSKLTWILAAVASSTTLLILTSLAWVINRSLKPVARLAGDIDTINEDQLDAQLDLNEAPNELLPVVRRLNNLLARLHAAFEREKSFTADAAHELRTPLAGLRSTLEVSLSRQRSTNAYREAMEKCLTICRRMQSDVESLLTLARLDGTVSAESIETVHVASVLHHCWGRWAEETITRQLDVHWQLDESLHLSTDAARFPMLIDNLLGNAVAHSNQAGFVHIEATLRDSEMLICITNSGSQIDATQIEHVFEPFWRGDAARSANGMHAGLGLSLCKKLADSLDCRIAARLTPGGDFSICLYFNRQQTCRKLETHVVADRQ